MTRVSWGYLTLKVPASIRFFRISPSPDWLDANELLARVPDRRRAMS